jgi:RNA-directed DNA polymerase
VLTGAKLQERYNGPRVGSVDELAKLICIKKNELIYYANNLEKHVHKITKLKKNGSPRHITAPGKRLSTILYRIKVVFFDEYCYPEYVFGLGGKTLKDHALVHAGNKELIQTDLTDFFPSITYRSIFRMWSNEFGCHPDVARILTKLTSLNGSLQQGFPTSSHIAAVIALPFTEAMESYCKTQGMMFSQYVDDLNYSGSTLDKRNLFINIITHSRRNGFSINKRKTKTTNSSTGKTITGVSAHENRLRASRAIRNRAARVLKEYSQSPRSETLRRRVSGYHRYLTHLSKTDGRYYRSKIDKITTASN